MYHHSIHTFISISDFSAFANKRRMKSSDLIEKEYMPVTSAFRRFYRPKVFYYDLDIPRLHAFFTPPFSSSKISIYLLNKND